MNETCSEDITTLKSANKLYAKGNDQGQAEVVKNDGGTAKNEDDISEVSDGSPVSVAQDQVKTSQNYRSPFRNFKRTQRRDSEKCLR